MPDQNVRRVYSTDGGRVPAPSRPRPAPARRPANGPSRPVDPADGVVRIRREKGGRGGKTVTTVTGLPGTDAEVEAMLKALKQLCGAGGTLDGRTVEVQGDHRDRVRTYLEGRGLNVKLAGG